MRTPEVAGNPKTADRKTVAPETIPRVDKASITIILGMKLASEDAPYAHMMHKSSRNLAAESIPPPATATAHHRTPGREQG
jgi:hypothetical protein